MSILLERVNERLRPSENWFVLGLLVTAVVLLVTAVREVRWTPEDSVLLPAAATGLLLGAVLAKRPTHAFWAWLLLLCYGLLITFITLARLWPPLHTLAEGWEAARQFWLYQGALFYDRAGSWLLTVSGGGSSRETLIFSAIMGLAAFLLAAFAAWATLRWQRPLPGLLLMGLVMALNGYFGVADIWWLVLFVGVAVLLTAVVNFTHLKSEWTHNQVDYPEDIQFESIGYAAMIALFLLALAMLLPSFSITRLQTWFASLAPVTQAESSFEQVFTGIDVPRQNVNEPDPGGVGGSGVLPRQYLLGLPPELAETEVMTAVVTINIQGQEFPAPAELLAGLHWRGLSYDVYTGRGWAVSEERLESMPPFRLIPLPAHEAQTSLTQVVYWHENDRLIRYTLGMPYLFDQATVVSWRGLNDLARVRAQTAASNNRYTGSSRLATAAPAQLRQAQLIDVPAPIMERYTALPDDLPRRISELAQEVTTIYTNPYDQARALEQFLRQYPYSLETPTPPVGADPVEYFLFDLQRGYCDYYASSMVVMARTLGLPARLVVGYLGQPPDDTGSQTIRQINAHSWVEIYFAGYGWVEFEPTAGFTSPRDTVVTFNPADFSVAVGPPPVNEYVPPPIPPAEPARPFPWLRLLIIGLLVVALLWWWRRQQQERTRRADGVVWSYGRLQDNARKIGLPATPSQTPTEFSQALMARLSWFGQDRRLTAMRAPIIHITLLYNQRRYGGMDAGGHEEATRAWKQLQRPFWRLRLSRKK
ncbi:MAG TPA: transglutaminase domain-containing protein [Chloroflexota bacterium]|nr:transglutaminase domain-containing protein [Chloroflexota bacterium]